MMTEFDYDKENCNLALLVSPTPIGMNHLLEQSASPPLGTPSTPMLIGGELKPCNRRINITDKNNQLLMNTLNTPKEIMDKLRSEEHYQTVNKNRSSRLLSKKKRKNYFYSPPVLKKTKFSESMLRQEDKSDIFSSLPTDVISHIFSWIVDTKDVGQVILVSHAWKEYIESRVLWTSVPSFLKNGQVNWINFRNLGSKPKGTEGCCYKAHQRSSGETLAIKRVQFPNDGESIPYYMLRAIAFISSANHPNIIKLKMANLVSNQLDIFMPHMKYTLADLIHKSNEIISPLGNPMIRRSILFQILQGIHYCHKRGVLHRNLKPKHVLLEKNGNGNYQAMISDFALVRFTQLPLRHYTSEVVTLWYRSPEVLMGGTYHCGVDIWAIGCIFAEMIACKTLFNGISDIEQLFKIFQIRGTPSEATWSEFSSLPNFGVEFPQWDSKPLQTIFNDISEEERDLLDKLLCVNPNNRITASEALQHPLFDGLNNNTNTTTITTKNCNKNNISLTNSQSNNTHIPHGVFEFADTYLKHLQNIETMIYPINNFLGNQPELKPTYRASLIDWLIDVIDFFNVSLRTVFLAAAYIDRYLHIGCSNYQLSDFQLLGAAALHIASKCEDVSYIGIKDLVSSCENLYSVNSVCEMSNSLINALEFKLEVPTTFDILNSLIAIIKNNQQIQLTDVIINHAHYLIEYSLLNADLVTQLPSTIAVASLAIALHYNGFANVWPTEFNQIISVDRKAIYTVMDAICASTISPLYAPLVVTRTRYSSSTKNNVANIAINLRSFSRW